MTNKELQEILKNYPDDAEVTFAMGDFWGVDYVEGKIVLDNLGGI
jgi:hypothetical protein